MSSETSMDRISPTAHATGYMWYRLGMSHPALVTPEGKRLDLAIGLMMYGVKRVNGTSFDALMMARHKGIDARLTRAIEDGRIGQIIEVAAGLSPRGMNFCKRYGDKIRYIETDLPAMAATKRKLLEDAGLLSEHHQVVELDALIEKGPMSLAALAKTLDKNVGTAIITEGLMSYIDEDTARNIWRRFARTLKKFPHGLYLSESYMRRENAAGAKAFGAVLGQFVKGKIHFHFAAAAQAIQTLRNAGFRTAVVFEPGDIPETLDISTIKGAQRVRVLEAAT